MTITQASVPETSEDVMAVRLSTGEVLVLLQSTTNRVLARQTISTKGKRRYITSLVLDRTLEVLLRRALMRIEIGRAY